MKTWTYVAITCALLLGIFFLPLPLVALEVISWEQCRQLSRFCGQASVVVACGAFVLWHVLKGKNLIR